MPHPDGTPADDVWDMPIVNPLSKERTGFPTQKPLALLERIIKASSNEGDVVFDPFAGSGTALAVAERLKRHWIGCEIDPIAESVVRRRLDDGRDILRESVEMKVLHDVPIR